MPRKVRSDRDKVAGTGAVPDRDKFAEASFFVCGAIFGLCISFSFALIGYRGLFSCVAAERGHPPQPDAPYTPAGMPIRLPFPANSMPDTPILYDFQSLFNPTLHKIKISYNVLA